MTGRPKRIGVLGVEPGSSHAGAQWVWLMNGAPWMTRRTGMEITHVWDKNRQVAEQFAARHGGQVVVDRYDAMAGQIEGVIQSGYMESFWSLELVRPYLEAGVPVLMDRPGGYSLRRIRALVELAARHGCPLMVTNNHEHHAGVDLMVAAAEGLGRLLGVTADCMTDRQVSHFSMHCIHGWYMLCPVLAGKVRRVRTFMAGESAFAPLTLMECENEDGSRFPAVLHRQEPPHRGWFKLLGERGVHEGTILPPPSYRAGVRRRPAGSGELEARKRLLTDFSLPPLIRFEEMIETRKMPQPGERIIEKTRVFLAMFKSLLEGGVQIEVSRLEEDWTAPNPYPGYFPEGYFPAVA